ncbi:probable magnesium transporter nipa1 [Phtheirospermum japonicum]|uniref:Probable magnesium transporter n=1 Tax=Phtheirospermum japonicum TaxID=374723 RepID=A0A830B8H7_9LAMI|nr:probable magnesium transporter nipa1 [Phtheirospermum japonicum]
MTTKCLKDARIAAFYNYLQLTKSLIITMILNLLMKVLEDMDICKNHFGGLACSLSLLNFTVIIGEFANFVAYMFAPAVLVTPLGALSSTVIVLHAPAEHSINSVEEIWELAIQPAFLLYTASAVAVVLVLVLYFEPRYGQTNIMVYIGVCSIIGSVTVMSIKAVDYSALSPQTQISWIVHANGEIWKRKENDELHPEFIAIIRQDHFT